MWDPATYLRYGDERGRPFHDLVSRIGAASPRTVVDLGCGPGNLTVTLTDRWPGARVRGLDSAPEMIAQARSLDSTVDFAVGDVRQWQPDSTVEVIVSNATLQWVGGHEELLTGWARRMVADGWLAVQVPGNLDAPSHQAIRAVVAGDRWRERLGPLDRQPASVRDPAGYAALLRGVGLTVDAWETTYLHLLAADRTEHPVLRWLEGTALRPIRAALPDPADWADFRDDLRTRLAAAYPVDEGVVYFPFRRVFVVAHAVAAVVSAPDSHPGRGR